MKKWTKLIMIGVCALVLGACGNNEQMNENIEDKIVGKTYVYEKGGFGGDFTITINEDGTFSYYEGMLSSYIGMGGWSLEEDTLKLPDNPSIGYPLINYFRVEDEALVFLAEKSTNFVYIDAADGDRFLQNTDTADK